MNPKPTSQENQKPQIFKLRNVKAPTNLQIKNENPRIFKSINPKPTNHLPKNSPPVTDKACERGEREQSVTEKRVKERERDRRKTHPPSVAIAVVASGSYWLGS